MADVTRHVAPELGVTEIRVHGVGGTPPEALLEQTGIHQVTGDETAGLFRGAVKVPGRTVEAYSWGGLTARSRSRALWILLLPFALINLAGWMVEPYRPGDDENAGELPTWKRSLGICWHEGLVLITGMLTTAMYVMWAALLSVNTVAFQCGAIPSCRDGQWFMEPFKSALFIDHAGRRIVVGLVVPLALLGLFWVLGDRSRRRYEGFTRAEDRAGRGSADGPGSTANARASGSVLATKEFWSATTWQGGLAWLHVASAVATLTAVLAYALWALDRALGDDSHVPDIPFIAGAHDPTPWLFAFAVLIGVGCVVAVAMAAWSPGTGDGAIGGVLLPGDRAPWLLHRARQMARAAAVLLLLTIVVAAGARVDDDLLYDVVETRAEDVAGAEGAVTRALVEGEIDPDDAQPADEPVVDLTAAPEARLSTLFVAYPNTDLWGFGWAPILLSALAVLTVLGFSVITVWRWFTWRHIHLDQLAIVVMLVAVAVWRYAPVVIAVASLFGAVEYAVRNRTNREQDESNIGGIVYAGVVIVAGAVYGFTRYLVVTPTVNSDPVPRLIPILAFGVTLAVLILLRTSQWWDERYPTGRASRPRPAARVAAVAIPAALVGGGAVASWLFERTEWLMGAVWLAWIVLAVVWLALFRYDGWRWNGPATVAVMGVGLLMGGFAGGSLRLVQLLNGADDRAALTVTRVYEWIVIGVVAAVAAGAVALVVWLLLARIGLTGTLPDDDDLRRDRSLAEGVRALDVVLTTVALLFAAAALAHTLSLHEATVAAPGDASTLVQLPEQQWIDQGPPADWSGIVTAASWAVVAMMGAGAVAIRSGWRDRAFRTRIGMLWDVVSFWPRVFHPFAPPAYAARAVPELGRRIEEVVGTRKAPRGAVVLSGHSQGSVLSLAVAVRLSQHAQERTRLVTHGSPLVRFYRTYFPRYFPPTLLEHVACSMGDGQETWDGGWLNFWRPTDPIGAPVFEPAPDGEVRQIADGLHHVEGHLTKLPDVELPDPVEPGNGVPTVPPPRVRGHSGYMADPVMWHTVAALAEVLRKADGTAATVPKGTVGRGSTRTQPPGGEPRGNGTDATPGDHSGDATDNVAGSHRAGGGDATGSQRDDGGR